jgi:hypothetical protein
MLTDDLALIFTDPYATVPVIFGSLTCRGFLEWRDAIMNDASGGQVLVKEKTLTILGTALPGLADDSPLTVDGTTYLVHDIRHAGPQGKLLDVILA